MEAFISRKRRRISEPVESGEILGTSKGEAEEESTDFKLAILSSLHPDLEQETLLEALLVFNGSIEEASEALKARKIVSSPKKKSSGINGYQASLASFNMGTSSEGKAHKPLTKRGKVLHLYSPKDIETHTPCTIIHNFLPAEQADALLRELLEESKTFKRYSFKLFDNVVQSPHTICLYLDSPEEIETKRSDYGYMDSAFEQVRTSQPEMRKASGTVKETVNREVERRIRDFYPDGKKLRYQSPHEWKPNAAFVNCYDGAAESVGYHSDHLTCLGPRAIIGSLSLGVAREFRVRKIVAQDDENFRGSSSSGGNDKSKGAEGGRESNSARADAQGQISIHLPHNSLLVMHAEMQEEWKHSIAPAQAIDPHPISGNKRLNVTYRYYKDSFHPRLSPRCRCGISAVLRCVQRKKENRGRYIWMCYGSYTPGKEGCSFFQWAEFDDDGEPPWAKQASKSAEPSKPSTEAATLAAEES